MNRFIAVLTMVLVLLPGAALHAGITLRVGATLPQGDFKDYAGNGYSADVVADLRPFALPYLSVPVMIKFSGLGEEKSDWTSSTLGSLTQESKITITGGGIGLKLEPPALPLKPFVEVLGRLASLEQDYYNGAAGGKRQIDSQTKFGYQINGGVKYPLAPKLSLQVGASYISLLGVKLLRNDSEEEIDASSLGIFAGITFNLGW